MHGFIPLYLSLLIGILCCGLASAQDEDKEEQANKQGLVIVEPSFVAPQVSMDSRDYGLVSYRERRGKWGAYASLGYSSYEPIRYEPNFLAVDFNSIYVNPEMPLIEFKFVYKRNFDIGSFGGELSVGMYKNDSDEPQVVDSSLMLIPVKLGAIFTLDSLFKEPYVVPYVSGGAYTIIFRESMLNTRYSGNTQVAPYFAGGLAFQLDWLDRRAAHTAFVDSGIQSTYLYVEVQKYIASSAEKDPDFENDISYSGGVRVEF